MVLSWMNLNTQTAFSTDGIIEKFMSSSSNGLTLRGIYEYFLSAWNPWHLCCGGVAANGFCLPSSTAV